jgi:hypothetical protein
MPNEISIKVNQKVGNVEEGSKVTGVEIGELHIHLPSQPKLQADWKKLVTRTHHLLNTIRDSIGDNIHLPRTAYIEQITQNFREHKVILITGESGCGKTVIAKSWTETVAASNSLLWWDVSDFEKDRFDDLGRGLQHSLKEILAAVSGETAYVVIDGLDRLFKPGSFRNIALLLNLLHLDQDISLWRVLVTCQSEELQRVLKALRDVNISITNWHVINVEKPSLEEVEPIWQKFPKLQSLLSNERLQSLLILPKHLDIIVTYLNAFPDTRQWVGESDFIEWLWQAKIAQLENKTASIGFLFRLAQIQADELVSEVPLDKFSPIDLVVCETLQKEKFLRMKESEGTIDFIHDLYGDWSRQRVLLAHRANLLGFINNRLGSILWHRALRLFSLHVLEQNSDISEKSNYKVFIKHHEEKNSTSLMILTLIQDEFVMLCVQGQPF